MCACAASVGRAVEQGVVVARTSASSSSLFTKRRVRSCSSTCTLARRSSSAASCGELRARSRPIAMLALRRRRAPSLTSWYVGIGVEPRLLGRRSPRAPRSISQPEKSAWYFFHGRRKMLSSETAQTAPTSSSPTPSRKTALYDLFSSSSRVLRRAIAFTLRRRPPLEQPADGEDRDARAASDTARVPWRAPRVRPTIERVADVGEAERLQHLGEKNMRPRSRTRQPLAADQMLSHGVTHDVLDVEARAA